MKAYFFTAILASSPLLANSNSGKIQCFPKNNLHLEDDLSRKDLSITEQRFKEIIQQVSDVYSPIVTSYGGSLKIINSWTKREVNAYASRVDRNWYVEVHGGLARRPEVTPDGFALVLCHEVGHHLAGYPFYNFLQDWASSEGQSDYFASQVCAKKLWQQDLAMNASFRNTIEPYAKEECDRVYEEAEAQNLCYRTASAGKSLATLLARINGEAPPSYENPSEEVVDKTFVAHPRSQCRLDTYLSASTCDVAFNDSIIPGRNNPNGQDSQSAEQEAAFNSCTLAGLYSHGLRPKCWYKPGLELTVNSSGLTIEELSGNGDTVWDAGETYGFNVAIKNNLLVPITNARLEMQDLNNDISTFGNYSNVAVAEAAYADESVPVVANVECGSNLNLKAKVEVGDWSSEFPLSYQIGAYKINHNQPVFVPDNNPNGIQSNITAIGTKTVKEVKVFLSLSHTRMKDLFITLTAPDGNSYVLYRNIPGYFNDFDHTFKVKVKEVGIEGDWTIRLSDSSRGEVGVLNQWNIDFGGVNCPVIK